MTPEKPDRPRPASAWEALDGHIAQHDRMVARHDRDPVPEDGSVPQTPQKKHCGGVGEGPGDEF